jgi:hypothetical protein
MSKFYATLTSDRANPKTLGGNREIVATAQSYQGSIAVRLWLGKEGDTRCEIVAGKGSTPQPSGRTIYLGSLAELLAGGPQELGSPDVPQSHCKKIVTPQDVEAKRRDPMGEKDAIRESVKDFFHNAGVSTEEPEAPEQLEEEKTDEGAETTEEAEPATEETEESTPEQGE